MSNPTHGEGGQGDDIRPSVVLLAVDAARRYFAMVVTMTVVGTFFGGFLALIRPNEFMSTAKLMVRPGLRDSVSPESAIAGASDSRPLVIHDLVANQMQILVGPELYKKTVRLVGIDRVLEPYDPRRQDVGDTAWTARLMHSLQAWWFAGGTAAEIGEDVDRIRLPARIIAENLRMAPEIGSNVISVSYTTHDAKLAQDVVDAVLKASLEIHREAFEAAASFEAIEKELTTLENAAVESEKQLLDFKVQNGIYEFEPQRRALLTYLSTLEEQVEENAVLIGTRTAEQDKLLQLKDQERVAESGTVSIVLNPAHTALLTFLNQLLLEELGTTTVSTIDPQVRKDRSQRLTAMINDTRARLEKEPERLELTAIDAGNSRRRRLETSYEDGAVTLQGLLKQRELRSGTRDDVRKRLAAFENFAQRLRGLELDATKKRQGADRLAVGLNNLRTIQRLDQLHLSNLQILYPATYMPEKIGPRRSLTLITGLFLGVALGVGMAYCLAYLDRCVRRPIDLRQLGLRVQGQIATVGWASAHDGVAGMLDEAGAEIAELWASLPFDRHSKGASIAFVSDTSAADASRVAGVFAAGLALRGGQRVAYVSCCEEPGWLLQRLGSHPGKVAGWVEVLHDHLDPGAALQPSDVEGLSIMVQGKLPADGPHPMQRAEFAAMLGRLQQVHDFVIIELPPLSAQPEGRAVLRMVDSVIVAAAAGRSTKVAVQAIVDSAVAAGTTLAGATLLV